MKAAEQLFLSEPRLARAQAVANHGSKTPVSTHSFFKRNHPSTPTDFNKALMALVSCE
jgi:hypothetical protein